MDVFSSIYFLVLFCPCSHSMDVCETMFEIKYMFQLCVLFELLMMFIYPSCCHEQIVYFPFSCPVKELTRSYPISGTPRLHLKGTSKKFSLSHYLEYLAMKFLNLFTNDSLCFWLVR